MGKKEKLILVLLSTLLLIPGWLSLSGLPLLGALVPLLLISRSTPQGRSGWWSMFWWALLCFVLWNVLTVWWIWFATPVGPIAATVVCSSFSLFAFMCYHTISKRASKALAYTALISIWIAMEYWHTFHSLSWPWLLLGNGFSNDIWAVQWYEYTGIFGGSLWVLATNILLFEAITSKRRGVWITSIAVAVVPLLLSLFIYFSYKDESHGTVKVAVVQPNIHFLEQRPSDSEQAANLLELMAQSPEDVDFIVTPEVSTPGLLNMSALLNMPVVRSIKELLREHYPQSAAVVGASTLKYYTSPYESETARNRGDVYYDIFNSAIYIPSQGAMDYHHKAKLVVGTESTPLPWLLGLLDDFVIDLGGATGQMGRGSQRRVFSHDKGVIGAAICYEALYGDYCGEFVKGGAEALFVISNDCWWGDTPGYRHLFTLSALRAVEHRRAIARSANTGISGFITARGDATFRSKWDERGVYTGDVALNSRTTFYTIYGDYIARVAVFISLLVVLYYIVVRVKQKNNLI